MTFLNDIDAGRGMQCRSRTWIVSGLTVAFAAGMICTSTAFAESWFQWPKFHRSDSGSQTADDGGSKSSSNKSSTKLNGTKPTVANRVQSAPTNPNESDEAPKEHWWSRISKKTTKPDKKQLVKKSLKSPEKHQEGAPVFVEKDPPPTADRIPIVMRSGNSGLTSQDEDDCSTYSSDDDVVANSRAFRNSKNDSFETITKHPKTTNSSGKIGLQIGQLRSRTRKDGGLTPVGFDGENAKPAPSEPADLRQGLGGRQSGVLPFEEKDKSSKIRLRPSTVSDELISLTVRDAPLSVVLSLIAEQHGFNLVSGGEVDGRVTVTLNDVELDEALNALLTINGYSWHRNKNILVVSKVASENRSSPMVRGVVMKVFRLNYVSAIDVEKVVMTLLSPAGRAVTTVVDIKSSRRTREEIVVEDLPEYVERIESYIAEIDRAPRQVLIEAHILQISLKDDCFHGVNLQKLFDIGNTHVALKTTGFANPLGSPAFFFGIDNNDFHSLIQALTTQTDSKTLATPRVLCLNGQHAKIHIGEQLGFLVTTTTQTSTLQNVNFLNVGVILDITPVITDEGLVMLHVKPEVSGGQINANGLPSATTTEVETTVMLADGTGMIIGGLIKEEDTENQSKIPYLGDLWLVGRLFQQRHVLRQRNEIIIALIPHILPHPDDKSPAMDAELERVRTRLLSPPLERVDRRAWEPDLPDAVRNPKHLFSGEILRRLEDPYSNGLPACEEE